MPTNKNALLRYRVLDNCFRNPAKRYFIDNLIEECSNALYEISDESNGVSRRQIFEDIKFMESKHGWNATILKLRDGRKVYYRYEDTSFSINNQPFNEMEENQIKEALVTLSRFKGLPQFEWIGEIVARIDSGIKISKNTQSVIEFDQNKYLKGLEFITPIYNAIIYKQMLSITYQSFKINEKQIFNLHSYYLKQYNNRWFVFGLNDASDRIINLALDRIIKIKDLKKKFKENDKVNFAEYFEDVIGVSVNSHSKPQEVLLSVNNALLPYIETKPLHGSQKIKERGESETKITLQLIHNYELESILLSFGEGLRVVEPKDLREKISSRIKSMGLLYRKNKSADKLHF
jgi:predicted DNA-binding transcriptional regulator YafY